MINHGMQRIDWGACLPNHSSMNLSLSMRTYARVRLSERIDCTFRDEVANGVRVIVRVYVYGKILGKDHDPHE